MPEHEETSCSAFIWYHADVELFDTLDLWVRKTATQKGIHSRLLIREEGGKTTFMEIYEPLRPEAARLIIEEIEQLAKLEAWHPRLLSPRKAEIFSSS
ncbi:MAG: hypothetical protein Q9M30_06470 [Mariprofundaceae bacterium]|nr:hypothetical protein [Mariprofundaceae bacterium]